MKVIKQMIRMIRRVRRFISRESSVIEINQNQQIENQIMARMRRVTIQVSASTVPDVVSTQLEERRLLNNQKQTEVHHGK
jgi:hypothetical protein